MQAASPVVRHLSSLLPEPTWAPKPQQYRVSVAGEEGRPEVCRMALLYFLRHLSFICLVNVVASWKMLKVKPTTTDWGDTKGS